MRVAALMLVDERVVLVRHRSRSSVYHLLPGGGVSFGETLEQALKREVTEETGLQCDVGRPLILSDTIAPEGHRHIVNITFACGVTGGAVTQCPDDRRIEAVDLAAPGDLSSMDLRPPIAPELLEALADPEGFRTVYVGSRYRPEEASDLT